MTDKDANATVSVQEVAQILYLRSGKGLLDSVLIFVGLALVPVLSHFHHFVQQFEEIFGTTDTISAPELNFTEYLRSLELSRKKERATCLSR